MKINKETLIKYDVPGPRYTSYPTAPEWDKEMAPNVYIEKLKKYSKTKKDLSVYIHIPFCQSLCSFCGCNVVIRKQDDKHGDQYLKFLEREIDLITEQIGKNKRVTQLHWGGGTPTFLNEAQIKRLFAKLQTAFDIDFEGEIAIEIDPRTIDRNKVKALRELGFNRVSMGVQDFTVEVQREVNRVQPFELVKEFYNWCRELDFISVNFDLIYGLPNQTRSSFEDTVAKVIELKPDRIALYSFAHVPWLKRHQQKIDTQKLPTSEEKIDIFLNSRSQLLDGGYQAIAMDHFALHEDEMAQAFNKGTLYRNFMGYTVKPADEYIGLGVTSIGFLENTFIQNQKTLPSYFKALDDGILPVERGKILSEDDQIRQWTINSFMCRFRLDKNEFSTMFKKDFDEYFSFERAHIDRCLTDDLLSQKENELKVTELGKIFIRNICMGFDWYLRQKESHKRFSKTI